MNRRLLVGVVLVALAFAVGSLRSADQDGPTDEPSAQSGLNGVEAPDLGSVDPRSGLDVVALDDLPPEAFDTVDAILRGGPYRFDRDDTVFQNREGILPDKPRGHYREYTVITPGEDDRGARRIVSGADGEFYYTADHYQSFVAVDLSAVANGGGSP